jgi:hypothetical protein
VVRIVGALRYRVDYTFEIVYSLSVEGANPDFEACASSTKEVGDFLYVWRGFELLFHDEV